MRRGRGDVMTMALKLKLPWSPRKDNGVADVALDNLAPIESLIGKDWGVNIQVDLVGNPQPGAPKDAETTIFLEAWKMLSPQDRVLALALMRHHGTNPRAVGTDLLEATAKGEAASKRLKSYALSKNLDPDDWAIEYLLESGHFHIVRKVGIFYNGYNDTPGCEEDARSQVREAAGDPD